MELMTLMMVMMLMTVLEPCLHGQASTHNVSLLYTSIVCGRILAEKETDGGGCFIYSRYRFINLCSGGFRSMKRECGASAKRYSHGKPTLTSGGGRTCPSVTLSTTNVT
jgi:hypothetical protein